MSLVSGVCEEQFGEVREEFTANLVERGDLGAALSVVVDGRLVIDLRGGFVDARRDRRWQRDTLVGVASTTKGIATLCTHMLVERGLLDLDEPVATYWPEFGQAGKGGVLVRHVLSHEAGLVATQPPLGPTDYLDSEKVLRALETTSPGWEPGTAFAYHPFTFGFILGELVRRTTGTTLGRFTQAEIAEPLDVEFYIGFGPELDARVADFVLEVSLVDSLDPGQLLGAGAAALLGATRAARAVEQPSGNGHGTARALAVIYGALAAGGEIDGVRILDAQTIARSAVEQPSPPAPGFPPSSTNIRWALGWMSNSTRHMGPNPRTFGNMGGGGSMAFADPDARVGFAHVVNRYRPPSRRDPRRLPLLDALYRAL